MSKRQRRYYVKTMPEAAIGLAGLPKRDGLRTARRIEALETDPRPRGCRKLRGTDDLYRIKSGDYRVIYWVSDDPPLVTITDVGHRRDIYRGL